MQKFVHLHCHSHYSMLDGANRIPELVQQVKKLGMNGIALTDHGNLHGAIEFYMECQKHGVQPILGMEGYTCPWDRRERKASKGSGSNHHLTLLAKNEQGWKNLIKMSSRAHLDGFYYNARIDHTLLEELREGVICLSGCVSSEFSHTLLGDEEEGIRPDPEKARKVLEYLHGVFGEDFYVEIQNNGVGIQKRHLEQAVDMANQMGLPLVATSDAHYLRKEDAFVHEVLVCVSTGKNMDDPKRMRFETDLFHVCGPEEMYGRFPGMADAVARSAEIAAGCDIKLDFGKRHFPVFVPPEKKTPEQYLAERVEEGLRDRYGDPVPAEVTKRAEHELAIIGQMGFATYFLVVWDFINFAVKRGIPCGARGSAVGAVVSYALKFSHVCPLEHGLLFERFLDPSRKEAPDIDVDFCQERREEVITYVREKYGADSVAQIATFGTMAARGAIKDVGRVLGMPLPDVTKVSEMIPKMPGFTIAQTLKVNPEFLAIAKNTKYQKLIGTAMALEGTNRQSGIHAAGVVIAPGRLEDYAPLQRVKDGPVTTQWDMGIIEKVGLLKMDFLGLATLTLIDVCVEMIERTKGIKIDIHKLPARDEKTFALLQSGDTAGVFQFESTGIRELLRKLRPDRIGDIVAATALYRPGPLEGGMVEMFVNRKHGREETPKIHPIMDEILKVTYGVIVFQEQVMQILNRLGGIPLGESYKVIKAISKKNKEVIDGAKNSFVAGAQKQGMSQEKAEEVFSLICKFAHYGFNKSHSAAYADLTFKTGYLKAYYPNEFMASLLSSEMDSRAEMVKHLLELRRKGKRILGPHVNKSEVGFSIENGEIRFGLRAINGVGREAAMNIVLERRKKEFKDVNDFVKRMSQKIEKGVCGKMIQAGAMDGLGEHRAWLLEAVKFLFASEKKSEKKKSTGQCLLFAEEDFGEKAKFEEDVPEWSKMECLRQEKEVLDTYVSGHPLEGADLQSLATHRCEEVHGLKQDSKVRIAGIFVQPGLYPLKNPGRYSHYGKYRIEDETGSLAGIVWGNLLEGFKGKFEEGSLVVLQAKVDKKNESEASLVATDLWTPTQARNVLVSELHLRLRTEEGLKKVADSIKNSNGNVRVIVTLMDEKGKECVMAIRQRIDLARMDLDGLRQVLGHENVAMMV